MHRRYSLEELMATAIAMEKESVDHYADLAVKMRRAGRQDLAAVFDRLVNDKNAHLKTIVDWFPRPPVPSKILQSTKAPDHALDCDRPCSVSAEQFDAYRSFVIAIRDKERAFAFWSHLATNTTLPLVRVAAEQMAHEELEHAKALRRERPRAFPQDQGDRAVPRELHDLAALELELCKLLEERSNMNEGREEYRELALEARALSLDLASDPLQNPAPVGRSPPRSLAELCEWLADYYVEAADNLSTQSARERAQALANIAIKRLAIIRARAEAPRGQSQWKIR
jgi:rubrerythrin